jgi:serine/threonine protein kinase
LEGEIVKLGDFGLLRERGREMTAYVSTRWYRAPEVILGVAAYDEKVDIFAAGCVLAEMVLGSPLFPGSCSKDQLLRIIALVGSPSPEHWPEGYSLMREKGIKVPTFVKQSLAKMLPDVGPDMLDLLKHMIELDPKNRPSAA